jgi:hypothetical protein
MKDIEHHFVADPIGGQPITLENITQYGAAEDYYKRNVANLQRKLELAEQRVLSIREGLDGHRSSTRDARLTRAILKAEALEVQLGFAKDLLSEFTKKYEPNFE